MISPPAVVPLKGDPYDGPCYEVSKLRSVNEHGLQVFARWCYKHQHWLNDAPPCKTATDELLDPFEFCKICGRRNCRGHRP